MPEHFFVSDLHLGHKNSITFTRRDGTPLRPFSDCDVMNEQLIANINSKVGHKDILFILGDATMPKSAIVHLGRINGKKRLILGNHDHAPRYYEGIFESVRAYAEFDNCVLSHIPVHTSQLDHRWIRNIHGHLHSEHVMTDPDTRDVRYYNVSIDAYECGTKDAFGYHSGMNFFPKSYDEIVQELYISK